MTSADNPWLRIPAADYEGHMDAVGQTAALRQLFASVYGRVRPRRLAVLGCTTGADFDATDSAVTDVAVGVDINPEYLQVAGERLAAAGRVRRCPDGGASRSAVRSRTRRAAARVR